MLSRGLALAFRSSSSSTSSSPSRRRYCPLQPSLQPQFQPLTHPSHLPPISLSLQGIKALDGIGAWFKAVYISYLMVMSSLLYIPITKMIVSVWICDTKQCATGEWYPLPSPTFNLREMFSADRSDDTHPA